MTAVFASSRPQAAGVYTDFAPPNLLTGTLGIPIGTLVKPTDYLVDAIRRRPLASDFIAPNLISGTFVKPLPPLNPQDLNQQVRHRWSATDFSPPVLVGHFLGPPALRPVNTEGDAWSRGKASLRGVYSDFIAPNVVLNQPPTPVGPYVPVDIGAHIIKKAVYQAFDAPNVLLNTISLIGAGKSFPGVSEEQHPIRRWSTTDFQPPNFLTTLNKITVQPPLVPSQDRGYAQRWKATDWAPPNLLTGPFSIFLGNPPKTLADPYVYALRKPHVAADNIPVNATQGVLSLVSNTPLSAQDDCAQIYRARALASDFVSPNLIAGNLVPSGPPMPTGAVTTSVAPLNSLPLQYPGEPSAYRRIAETVNQLIQSGGQAANTGGTSYNPLFLSGQVQYAGPGNQLAGDDNLIFGLAVPNPTGTAAPCLLTGSGGGNGQNVFFVFISDQAFDVNTPGNDIFHTAGETQPGSSERGGNWTVIAGASDAGAGGQALVQGGTSVSGPPGFAILQGGNNTAGNAPAGDVFVIGGEEGSQGANVHLVATIINNLAGVIRHRFNSTITLDEFADGSWFFYNGSGWGTAGAPLVSGGQGQPAGWAEDGYSGTYQTGDGRTVTVVQGRIVSVQ